MKNIKIKNKQYKNRSNVTLYQLHEYCNMKIIHRIYNRQTIYIIEDNTYVNNCIQNIIVIKLYNIIVINIYNIIVTKLE